PLADRLPVDVIDADDEILVKADLPGRDPSSISVQLEDSRTVHIEVGDGTTAGDGRFVVRERTREGRSRSVTLPAAVDESETDAEYDRGVLTVHLPKLSGDSEGTDIPVN
ncbi:MAG: HSP20 family protein, partial [Natronomonas sp.]